MCYRTYVRRAPYGTYEVLVLRVVEYENPLPTQVDTCTHGRYDRTSTINTSINDFHIRRYLRCRVNYDSAKAHNTYVRVCITAVAIFSFTHRYLLVPNTRTIVPTYSYPRSRARARARAHATHAHTRAIFAWKPKAVANWIASVFQLGVYKIRLDAARCSPFFFVAPSPHEPKISVPIFSTCVVAPNLPTARREWKQILTVEKKKKKKCTYPPHVLQVFVGYLGKIISRRQVIFLRTCILACVSSYDRHVNTRFFVRCFLNYR